MLAFRETGPSGGVPVVVLHALGSKAGTWDDFAARLDRRVVAVDLPGHGDSAHAESYSLDAMADGVAELLGEEADLVGHSMGGRVAVLLAQRLRGRVRRLGAIMAPTLLISGGPSSHVGRESLEWMGRLVVIEDAGHRVHGSRPEEFAAVAGEFLGPV